MTQCSAHLEGSLIDVFVAEEVNNIPLDHSWPSYLRPKDEENHYCRFIQKTGQSGKDSLYIMCIDRPPKISSTRLNYQDGGQ